MNYKECQQEPSILEALRTGNWNDSHSQHLNDCSDCRETVDVARWMRLLAQGLREPLPDAKIVWLRAQIAGETARRDRVLAPVMLAHILVQVIISVCSAGWLFWKWPEIGSALTRLVATPWRPQWMSPLCSRSAGASLSMNEAAVRIVCWCVRVLA